MGAITAALVRSRATRDLLRRGRWVVRQTQPQALDDARALAAATGARVGALWFLHGDTWAVAILPEHAADEDCTLDADGSCTVCGVWHGAPCSCGGRGFHRPGCPELDTAGTFDAPYVLRRLTRRTERR